MIPDIIRTTIKFGLLVLVLSIPQPVQSQVLKGKVLSSKTKAGISYVNIGIIGKNIGTVSDESGIFTLNLDRIDQNDSLRFIMLGYKSETVLLGRFRDDSSRIVYLDPILYNLQEVKVIYHKPKIIKIGTMVTSGIGSGFGHNFLGCEFGIKLYVRQPVRLNDLNLNVSKCTFDTVTYRLNIYHLSDHTEYKNILTQPIYVTFTKDQINKPVTFDLRKYSIVVEGDIIVALELYKDLGDGNLFFFTGSFSDFTYWRRTIEGSWIEAGGIIGMYLRGQVIR